MEQSGTLWIIGAINVHKQTKDVFHIMSNMQRLYSFLYTVGQSNSYYQYIGLYRVPDKRASTLLFS